jgi:TolB-like protein
MHPAHDTVQQLAEAVADGKHVDWDHAESSVGSAAELNVVRQLRRLAGLADAARTQAATWGPLFLRGEVGHGTFGTVYRAWDPRLDREVALKLLPETAGAAQPSTVVSEGKLLAAVRHPNVVTVFGADTFDGRVGIWMEFVTGRTLKAIVDEQGPFGAHEAAVIGRDICRALAAVHQRGFVHRDVKAQNVMREAGGRTVLMDFGAGTALPAGGAAAPALTGTPAYLAPEVLAGEAPTVVSDLYSLGILLFYLVSGGFPVASTSLEDLRARHARGERRLLRDLRPDLPQPFLRAVDAALSPDPAARPQSAGAMEALLDQTLVEPAQPRPSPERERGWGLAWLAGATVIAALAGGAWLSSRDRADAPAAAATRNSVAILPFRNLTSPDGTNDYFSEGITADLVAYLSALRDVRVIAGTSTRRLAAAETPERDIAAELGVAAVLTGSVRQSGDRVRIVATLIDSRGEQLWSEGFERTLDDVFLMQTEVARKIAVALKGELSPLDADRFAPRSRSFDAFNAYLRGRYYWGLRTEDGFNRAIQHFQDAAARDPGYAAAYTGLADTYTAMGVYAIVPRADAYARAAAAAEKAIAIDPSLAEAHASLAYVRKNQFQWQAAERAFQRALELKPGYAAAHHWYSIFLTQHGRFAEAITEIKTAISLDPLSVPANLQLGSLFLVARRYDSALAQLEAGLQMDAGAAIGHRTLGETYTHMARFDLAHASFERATRLTGPTADDYELKADLAYLHAREGRRGDALKTLVELRERYQRAGEEVATSIAAIHVALGEHAEALAWLQRAADGRESAIGYVNVHPRWDPLRADPRFTSILTTLGFTPGTH